jgi:thiol-disulfide isomerase/thioredoxin
MNRALILCALTASSASCATVARAPAVGQSVQSLLAPVNHGEVSPIELEGKVVLVDVWASWCQPCAEALPFYAQLQDELKAQGFVLLTINVDADRRAADAFLKSLGEGARAA